MQIPPRTLSQPMRVEVCDQECSLEKDQAGNPDRSRSAKYRQELFRRDRLDEKEQEGPKKSNRE